MQFLKRVITSVTDENGIPLITYILTISLAWYNERSESHLHRYDHSQEILAFWPFKKGSNAMLLRSMWGGKNLTLSLFYWVPHYWCICI